MLTYIAVFTLTAQLNIKLHSQAVELSKVFYFFYLYGPKRITKNNQCSYEVRRISDEVISSCPNQNRSSCCSILFIYLIFVLLLCCVGDRANASVTSDSRAPYGLFPGCFEQKSYVHSRGLHGPSAAPYEFCFPNLMHNRFYYLLYWVFMHAL